MPESEVNFIFQRHLQRERCPFEIVAAGIEIDQEQMMAKFIENNLYIFDTPNFQLLLSSFIRVNLDTLWIWHLRLGYL